MERVAYLTIDDSPSPHTDKIVTYLAGHGIQALFFCIGEKIEAYPDQMIGAVQAGHALANHTYAHK
ncbi:MAG: polysaccharide deacetylase family protein, partial [Alphaproteobacteria bacterium]|nr:polysaccharide deacetylase family protein [Alphaproteobacteria bacterium]